MNKLKIVGIMAVFAVLGSLVIALRIAKFNNLKNLAKKAAPVAACGLIVAISLAGIGGVNVASAQEQTPCDPFANRYECYLNCKDSSFKTVDKPVNEIVLEPMEIEKRLWGDLDTLWMDQYVRQDKHLNGAVWYDKEGYAHYGTFKISEIDAAVWMDKHWQKACGERESARQLYPVDTDGDGLPEILMCGLNDYYLRNTDLGPIKDNIVRCDDGYYLLDIFHKPENENLPGMLKVLYTNPDGIKIVPFIGEDIIKPKNWDEVVNKTKAEIGLDKDDRGIFGRTPSQTSSPAESTPSEVPKGEEKGISGFDAINSLRIEVQKDGDADFSAQYSLSRWEQFYLWIKGALGDRDATKNHIESKIESNLERGVESLEISEDGRASFVLKDYVGKVERNEGTWYWTKIYLSEDACERINLCTVSVIFPDGFIYEFDGKLPNIKHLEDENLATLYLEAKITKGIYEAIYCQYEESQIGKATGDFITKIDMEFINMIATSPIPYSEFLSLINLAKDFKTDMGEYNKILDNMMTASYTWGEILGQRIGFSNDVKNMAELKEEKINLIYSITSNDEISYESRESLKQELIDNLEIQKGVIVKIKGSASNVSISGTDPLNVKEIKQYFNEIFKNTRKLADTDLKYVEQGLTTLKEEK